ncbi:DUF2515 family protein [Cohnella sp. GCM10027633]|uniref:DUF2515 family protein n=1 Tax=unclassified Cohnella TaxID=2636738 RepID=UPI003631F89B
MNRRRNSRPTLGRGLYLLTKKLALGLVAKLSGLRSSYRLTRRRSLSPLRAAPGPDVLTALERVSERSARGQHLRLTDEEERLCEAIRRETDQHNRNNVTRTMAYWRLYERHPELHWALLAHLVSRNGGWNMTDLRGQWLPGLIEPRMIDDVFRMLETCNALIFGDAYPQLLLYAEGKRLGASLVHLLPRFGVSAFMTPFWNKFADDGIPAPLTSALIVNEQHVIQRPVVEDRYYADNVLGKLSFRAQPWLQNNQIVFPLRDESGHAIRLAGRVLERFDSLRERIRFGQMLYAMLYGYPAILERAVAFARGVPHTGSRADYWPHRYASVRREDGMPEGHAASYSPTLADAWPDQPLKPTLREDWFESEESFVYLRNLKRPLVVDMTHEHLFGQSKLEAAALALRSFKNGDSSFRTGRG